MGGYKIKRDLTALTSFRIFWPVLKGKGKENPHLPAGLSRVKKVFFQLDSLLCSKSLSNFFFPGSC
jgi:hypothetical protein